MNLPTNHRDLAVLIRHHIDPDNDAHTRPDPVAGLLQSAGFIRWSGAPRRPGWTPTETGTALINRYRGEA